VAFDKPGKALPPKETQAPSIAKSSKILSDKNAQLIEPGER
jgi:hypothetical protein